MGAQNTNCTMKFIDIPEDRQREAINTVALQTGLPPSSIEKDWWVTQVLKTYRHAFNLHTRFEEIRPFREGYTFSDKIAPADWPNLCRGILDCQADTMGCDKMMLSVQNNISGLPQHSYFSICCGFASKK